MSHASRFVPPLSLTPKMEKKRERLTLTGRVDVWDMVLDIRRRASVDICGNGSQLLLFIICAGHGEDVKDGFGGEERGLFIVAPGDCHVLFRFPDGVADGGIWVDECI